MKIYRCYNVLINSVLMSLLLYACSQEVQDKAQIESNNQALLNPKGDNIITRFNPPVGFERVKVRETSFAWHLQHLPLKAQNSKVKYHNGTFKEKQVHQAVVNLPIGNKNLHQCADAIIRLRAEHLYQTKQYESIEFKFTNGFPVSYKRWQLGEDVKVIGNECKWVKGNMKANNYQNLWKYLELIFTYAGTISLSEELQPVSFEDMKIGDVFIQAGSPGHAVIVVDMATKGNEKVFLLAQSYMPAQEIHVLKNPMDSERSPWYSTENLTKLETPEWTFNKTDLKRFPEE